MSAAKVSAVITSYNRADALPTAVESVLAQTHAPFEVLVSDNCSEFDIHALLQPYGDRVRAWRNEQNLGVSGSRNAGAAAATGDFVAFLDDDDEWMPHKLERQVAEIGAAPMSVCGKERVPGGVRDTLPTQWVKPDDLKVGNIFCGGSGFFVRRTLFERIQFDPALRFGEDWDFMIQAARIAPILYQGEALFYYNVPVARPSLTNAVKDLKPHEIEPRYAAAEKNKDFLGPKHYRRRIAEDTLAFIGTRRDPSAYILYSMRRAGVAATAAVLGDRVVRSLARR